MGRQRYNNALHLTKRVGAPASQAVVEARFAGERECSANCGESGAGMNGRRLASVTTVAVTLGALAGAYAYGGLVVRWPRGSPPPQYIAEALRPGPPHPPPVGAKWSDPAPGYMYVGSPDGRYVAFSRDARRYYHTVFVWDERTRALHPVVSIQEGDPGSGTSHEYRWTADSGALVLTGWGALPFRETENPLLYVYVVGEDKLYRVTRGVSR